MADIELDKIGSVIERVTASEGLELVHWELKGQRSKALLRVTIDSVGGITHKDCVNVNDQVGTILDVEDLIPFAYTLEITSPGLGRTLDSKADFDRNLGHLARVRASEPVEGRVSFKGRIERVSPEAVTIVGRDGEPRTVSYSNILAANLVQVPKGARGSLREGSDE